MSKIIDVLERDSAGLVRRAAVRDNRAPVAVVVTRDAQDTWTPCYGLRPGGRILLPSRFTLNRECQMALDGILPKGA